MVSEQDEFETDISRLSLTVPEAELKLKGVVNGGGDLELGKEPALLVLVGKEHSLLGIGCEEKAKAVSEVLEAIAKHKVLHSFDRKNSTPKFLGKFNRLS